MSFTDQDGNPLCTTRQVSAGSASCTTAELPAGGFFSVTAAYSGDTNYLGSTATTAFGITRAATSLTASANPTSTAYGDTVTLSAGGLPADATGTVGFTDQHGNALCIRAQVSAGAAACTTAELPAGDFSPVTATYSGDANYLGSTASTEFASPGRPPRSRRRPTPTRTPYGEPVTLSASGLPADATGTVSFADPHGNHFCTTGQVNAGAASCATAVLPAGDYSAVTATYSGDANYLGSTAATEFAVAQAATSFTASADPGTTPYGSTVSLAAGGLPADATGTVSFTDQDRQPTVHHRAATDGAAACAHRGASGGRLLPGDRHLPGGRQPPGLLGGHRLQRHPGGHLLHGVARPRQHQLRQHRLPRGERAARRCHRDGELRRPGRQPPLRHRPAPRRLGLLHHRGPSGRRLPVGHGHLFG